MANTGVLPFVRGINFAKNDFTVSFWMNLVISVIFVTKFENFIRNFFNTHPFELLTDISSSI